MTAAAVMVGEAGIVQWTRLPPKWMKDPSSSSSSWALQHPHIQAWLVMIPAMGGSFTRDPEEEMERITSACTAGPQEESGKTTSSSSRPRPRQENDDDDDDRWQRSLHQRLQDLQQGIGKRYICRTQRGFLNIHEQPGDPHRVDNLVGQLVEGQVVTSIGPHQGDWIRHDAGGWSIAQYGGFTWLEPLPE